MATFLQCTFLYLATELPITAHCTIWDVCHLGFGSMYLQFLKCVEDKICALTKMSLNYNLAGIRLDLSNTYLSAENSLEHQPGPLLATGLVLLSSPNFEHLAIEHPQFWSNFVIINMLLRGLST